MRRIGSADERSILLVGGTVVWTLGLIVTLHFGAHEGQWARGYRTLRAVAPPACSSEAVVRNFHLLPRRRAILLPESDQDARQLARDDSLRPAEVQPTRYQAPYVMGRELGEYLDFLTIRRE